MPRSRKPPVELLGTPATEASNGDLLDRAAAVTLEEILKPIRETLATGSEHRAGLDTEGLRQLDLAADIGTSPQTISNVLNGQRWPNLQLLLQLLAALECRLVARRENHAQ